MSGALASLMLLLAGFAFIVGESKQTKRMVLAAVAVLAVGPFVEHQLGSAAKGTLPVIASVVSVVMSLIVLGLLTMGALRILEHRRQRAERPNLTVRRREVERHPEPWDGQRRARQPDADNQDDLGLLG
jgi:membrane-bound ClpP family serine protease